MTVNKDEVSYFIEVIEAVQDAESIGLRLTVDRTNEGVLIKPPEGIGYFQGIRVSTPGEIRAFMTGYLASKKLDDVDK
jgi:hypothetical protein